MIINALYKDDNLQETTVHGSPDFPMEVYVNELEKYEGGYAGWHWHKEIEFVFVLYGDVEFYDGRTTYTLHEGEGVFYNSNVLHMMKPKSVKDAVVCAILADPLMLYGFERSRVQNEYVNPFMNHTGFISVELTNREKWQGKVLKKLRQIHDIYHEAPYGYELEMKILLQSVWLELIRGYEGAEEIDTDNAADFERIKKSLYFINTKYSEKVSLQDIADAAKISKSECCRCFQRVLKTAPIEYLIRYRLYQGEQMLIETDWSISVIAEKIGFSNSSHFSKFFYKEVGCMPSEFRKNQK